jgi:HEAT repeat protein
VTAALQKLEKQYPTSTKAIPAIKKLLADSRPEVRRKSARVLGVLHAEVSETEVKQICGLLKGSQPAEVIDGLKSLRGLKSANSAIPEILPLLKHQHPNVIRDACRTLAVLGNKDLVPSIEPLLNHPNAAVKKDAQDAIFALRAKS